MSDLDESREEFQRVRHRVREVELKARLRLVHDRIAAACARAGRDPSEVTLVPVTKTHPPELIEALLALKVQEVGENRVQELRDKDAWFAARDGDRPRWHFVGSLQRNKVKYLARMDVALVHAVDSVALAAELDRHAVRRGDPFHALLEVNVSGEASKRGFGPDEVAQAFSEARTLKGVHIRGLMTMAPFEAEPEATRPVFRALRELRDRLQEELDCPLPVLSMGMSNDFEVAIEEGATCVRVGTALFGPRETAKANE